MDYEQKYLEYKEKFEKEKRRTNMLKYNLEVKEEQLNDQLKLDIDQTQPEREESQDLREIRDKLYMKSEKLSKAKLIIQEYQHQVKQLYAVIESNLGIDMRGLETGRMVNRLNRQPKSREFTDKAEERKKQLVLQFFQRDLNTITKIISKVIVKYDGVEASFGTPLEESQAKNSSTFNSFVNTNPSQVQQPAKAKQQHPPERQSVTPPVLQKKQSQENPPPSYMQPIAKSKHNENTNLHPSKVNKSTTSRSSQQKNQDEKIKSAQNDLVNRRKEMKQKEQQQQHLKKQTVLANKPKLPVSNNVPLQKQSQAAKPSLKKQDPFSQIIQKSKETAPNEMVVIRKRKRDSEDLKQSGESLEASNDILKSREQVQNILQNAPVLSISTLPETQAQQQPSMLDSYDMLNAPQQHHSLLDSYDMMNASNSNLTPNRAAVEEIQEEDEEDNMH